MSEPTWRNFLIVVRRVLKTPLAAGLLSLGLVWALLLHNSLWGAAGLGAAIAGVALYALAKLQDEAFVRGALQDARAHDRRADAMRREFRIEELDVESRVRMKEIARLHREIAEEVQSSPIDEVAAGLANTVEQTAHLVDRGLALAQKRRELQRYLNRTDEDAMQARILSIETRLAKETDPARKSELEVSLAAKRRELADYGVIRDSSERILGQLDSIESSFAALRARLVRIRSTNLSDWVAANEELKTELGGLTTAVDGVEATINEVLSVGGSGEQ
mgnify:CR=1 FL=1